MALNIGGAANHREREKGFLVYPVYSRRAKGLSIGINLFPDKKNCPFDCPYCEVFPFASSALFSREQMETDLRLAISAAQEQGEPIKDICFSGNGEPTLSPAFGDALKSAENIRAKMAASAELVVISNGAGLLQPQIFSLLCTACENPAMNIWLKLDAATPEWYKKMNRCSLPFDKLTEKKKEFSSVASVTIQTMLCAINGEQPPQAEIQEWETLVCDLAANKKDAVRKVQMYGKARSAPEDPLASPLPDEYLEKRAASLRRAFAEKKLSAPVEIFS
jgi:histidinol dehydrogenase